MSSVLPLPPPALAAMLATFQVPNQEQVAFIQAGTLKCYRQNEYLLRETRTCDTFVFVAEGVLCHGIPTDTGEIIIRNFCVAPSFCSYSIYSFLSTQPSWNFCKALTRVTVLEWPMSVLRLFLEKDIWSSFFQRLLVRFIIQKETRDITMLRDGALTRYQLFIDEYPNLLNQIPQHYVASYLNLKPQSLSRIKRQMARL